MQTAASEGSIPYYKDRKLAKLKKQYAQSGPNYFNKSAVGSSKSFFQVAGTILAIPYKTGATKVKSVAPIFPGRDAPTSAPATGESEYGGRFQGKRNCYSSMDNKPLEEYNPNAYRSRNAIPDVTMPYKNSSSLNFGANYARQYVSTHNNSFTGAPCASISNSGILAEKCAIKRRLASM